MRRFGVVVLLVLLLILALLLVLPNLKGCSSQNTDDPSDYVDLSEGSSSSLSSLIARFITGPSDDGLCDVCGAPATMKKRGYEVCQDCYNQAVEYYKNNY